MSGRFQIALPVESQKHQGPGEKAQQRRALAREEARHPTYDYNPALKQGEDGR